MNENDLAKASADEPVLAVGEATEVASTKKDRRSLFLRKRMIPFRRKQ